MNADEMRIAVTSACPDVFVRPTGASGWNYRSSVGRVLPCIDGDPLKDLNAIRDAAMSQPLEVRKAMRYYLWQMEDQMTAHLASAETMTKALLLAIEKWKEPSCTPRG